MGGAVSAGTCNSELVDNLCNEGYITRPEVERVFRVVDRADYMTFTDEDDRLEAYEDHAWRMGSVHISAPCIYTKAMEALRLKEGMSFLNVGSGTGYLSTLAGLLLGSTGVNHGVELHAANVDYATEKLAAFKESSQWYDPLAFCEPVFLVGNGLLMSPGHVQYDRVYCGAACPSEHVNLMKSLLKVGGVLVFPVDNKLECVSRVEESKWTCEVVLPSVSFASLVMPSDEELKQLPVVEFKLEPNSLKQLCRVAILKYVTRQYYSLLPSLPLPPHLKDYVAHYREWGAPPDPLPLKCEQQHSCTSLSQSGTLPSAASVNGRRILLCSFNGVVFQIPLDGGDSDSSEDRETNEPAMGAGAGPEYLQVDTDMDTDHSHDNGSEDSNPDS